MFGKQGWPLSPGFKEFYNTNNIKFLNHLRDVKAYAHVFEPDRFWRCFFGYISGRIDQDKVKLGYKM